MELLYALALRLYPPGFRRLYGRELREAYRELLRSAREEGGRGRAFATAARAVADAARTGLAERLSTRGYRRGGGSSFRFPRKGPGVLVADAAQDLRYALRTLARSRAFAGTVVATLALGIGANTAVFSLVYGVLLRPLPFGEGERLVNLRQRVGEGAEATGLPFAVREIEGYRAGAPAFADVAEYHSMSFVLSGPGDPELVAVGVVSSNYFDLLGMAPALGRGFVEAEDRPGAPPVVVLSDRYWRARFDADPAVVGTTVSMNGEDHTIVGVLPPIPQYPEENDVYMPISVCPTRSSAAFQADPTGRMMTVLARLAPGASLSGARDEAAEVAGELAASEPGAYRDAGSLRAEVVPLRDALVARARSPFVALLVTSGLLLAVACANAASLSLARANRRVRETAVRVALGAGRARLARQLLVEGVVLGIAGGAVGFAVAVLGFDALVAFGARFTTRALEIDLDRPVLLFTLVVSVATGVVFGLAPAAALRGDVSSVLGAESATVAGRRRRAQRFLVAVQVAFTFAVLATTGVMLRSLHAAAAVDVGLRTDGVLTARLTPPEEAVATAGDQRAFFDTLAARLAEHPGVHGVARSQGVPLGNLGRDRSSFRFVDADPGAPVATAEWRTVSRTFFEVLDVPVVDGRGFTERDGPRTPFVAVVNEAFARRWLPGESPVGRRVVQCFGPDECNGPMTVVGVVGDLRPHGVEAGVPEEVYRLGDQVEWGGAHLLLRTTLGDAGAVRLLRREVRALQPGTAVSEIHTLTALRADSIATRRLYSVLLGLFAAVALGLTLTGLAGLLTLSASARSRELAVRKALGARGGALVRLVVGEGVTLALAGLLAGGGLYLAGQGVVAGLLWGVRADDPGTLAAVAALYLAVALVACWIPARRVASGDVVATLGSA